MQKAIGVAIAGAFGLSLAAIALFGERTPAAPPEWTVVGGIEGAADVKFVRLAEGLERTRAVYDRASEQLCGQPNSPRICFLYFYAAQDPTPPTMPRRQWFSRDGAGRYPYLAMYTRNRNSNHAELGGWDCERAGVEGAPRSALCGPGVKETYDAVLKIASRTSTASACSWPRTDDVAQFEIYLAKVSDAGWRDYYRDAFNTMNSGRGPDNLQDCPRLRERIEAAARNARDYLGMPQPGVVRQNVAPRGGGPTRR